MVRHFYKILIILTCSLLVNKSFAQKVILVKKNKAVIIVKKGQKFQKKVEYYATGKKSDAMFKVLKKKGRKIVVKFYNGKLFKNDRVSIERWAGEEADLDQGVSENKKEKKSESKSSFRYGFSVFYNNGATGSLKGTFRQGSTTNDAEKIEIGYDSSFGFGGEMRMQLSEKYALLLGGEYHLARNENAVNLTRNGSLNSEAMEGLDSIQSTIIYAGLAVHINPSLYIPASLNYNLTRYDTTFTNTNSAGAGGIGYQIGFGYWVSSSIAVEANYRILTYSLQYQDVGNNVRFDSTDGTLSGLDFGLKYFF